MTLPLRHPAATSDSQASKGANEVNPIVEKAKTEIKSKGIDLYCDVCERKFVDENGMRMHLETSKDHKAKASINKFVDENGMRMHLETSKDHEAKAGIKSRGNALYCDVCEREFVSENGMQMHFETSKDHKKRVKMQKLFTHARDLKPTTAPNPSTFTSTMLYGHLAHAQNSLATPTYGFTEVGSSTLMSPRMIETSSRHGQAENAVIFPSHTSTKLQPQTQKGPSPHTSILLPQLDQTPIKMGISQANSSSQMPGLKHKGLVPTMIPFYQQSIELKSLSEHCHSSEDLLKHKYLLCLFTTDDIAGLFRCQNCRGLKKNLQTRDRPCLFHPKGRKTQKDGKKFYSCCGEMGPGCVSLQAHVYGKPDRFIEKKCRDFALTPAGSSQIPKRRAVTLDCEMAGVVGGMSEVICLCVADYLTGETLINSLVSPTRNVVDWRTQFSGVTRSAMAIAQARHKTLKGWQQARSELWKYIDEDTILVGQALQHDLEVLRMIHTNVVDSAILTKNALCSEFNRHWGLKVLCIELLGIEIQNKGREGHDCLEDALAAREVVLWCCRHPQELERWGMVKREEEEKKLEERKKAQEERKKEKEKKKEEEKEKEKKQEEEKEKEKTKEEGKEEKPRPEPEGSRPNATHPLIDYFSENENEIPLHSSDIIAEDLGWSTGYNPSWSD